MGGIGSWGYLLWGLFGGALVAGLDFITIVGRVRDWPWKEPKEMRFGPYISATLLRVALGGGLALAAGQSNLIFNAISAVGVGVATPLIVEKLGKSGGAILDGGDGNR